MMQISRSEQKRRIQEIGRLARELVLLPESVREKSPELEEIRPLLRTAARQDRGARQRQVKYIAKQLQHLPLEPLYTLVSRHRGAALVDRKREHLLTGYRDALIEDAFDAQRHCRERGTPWEENWTSTVLNEVAVVLPEMDGPSLARLAWLFVRTRNPRYSREILRSLRAAQDLRDRAAKQDQAAAD